MKALYTEKKPKDSDLVNLNLLCVFVFVCVMSGCVCLVCEYVCINVRGNSSLRAVGSSCRRAVFVQPGFVGISYPTHV